MRRFLYSLLAATMITLSASSAWAGPASDTVKAKQTELFKLLEAESNDANKKKIAAIFDEMLEYDALAAASLGEEWKNLKDAEKTEFKGLLKQLVTRAYEKNLRKTLSWNIEYLGDSQVGSEWLVKTKAKHKTDAREDPLEINFKLVDKGKGKYGIVDIVTEEVSLVTSYRSQFVKIIKKDGFAGLTKKMKEKIAKGDG
jgi:phospholipid transport system substrate-binding protein